jgi:HSP20 family molecular chaperone IbpA
VLRIGQGARAFTLFSKIDQDNISAEFDDGVFTLALKKTKAAVPRRSAIS